MRKSFPKIVEWGTRYVPAEIAAIALATIGASVAHGVGVGPIITAYVGTVCNYIGYYGVIISRELWSGSFKVDSLMLEFMPAEILDFAIIRPGMLALFPLFISNHSLAVLTGATVASVLFYVPVILSYEHAKGKRNRKTSD